MTDRKNPHSGDEPSLGEALAPQNRDEPRLSGDRAALHLIESLNGPDPKARLQAASELAKRGDERAVQPLLDLMRGNPDLRLLDRIVWAFGKLGGCALDALQVVKTSPDTPDAVHIAVLDSLKKISENHPPTRERIASFLVDSCRDPSEVVSINAFRVLGDSIYWNVEVKAQVAAELMDMVRSAQTTSARKQAIDLLGYLGDRAAVPLLIGLLNDPDKPHIGNSAAGALGNIGDPSAASALLAALYDPANQRPIRVGRGNLPVNFRATIILALGQVGGPDTGPVLLKALPDEDSAVRWSATLALGHLHDPDYVPVLLDLLKDPHLCIAAVLALSEIGGPEATAAVIECSRIGSDEQRFTALESFERLYHRTDDPALHTTIIQTLSTRLDDPEPINKSKPYSLTFGQIAGNVLANINGPEALAALQQREQQ